MSVLRPRSCRTSRRQGGWRGRDHRLGDDGGRRAGAERPYTAALLEHLEQPLEIGLLFRRVRAQVLASTSGQQRPHEYHSLLGEHYLSVPPTADSVTVVATPASVPDVVPVDVEQMDAAQLRLLAEQGDAPAQFELGWRHVTGEGVREDQAEAGRWFRRAAEQGYADAEERVAFGYQNGHYGFQSDYGEAARWYRRAIDQGNADAMNNFGWMHSRAGLPAGLRRSGSLVPTRRRTGKRLRAIQPRQHVRAWSRRASRSMGSGPVVPHGGRSGP